MRPRANAAAVRNDTSPEGGEPPLRMHSDLVEVMPGSLAWDQEPSRTDSERLASVLAPGTCVADRYIICDVLGVGGAAVVYAAEQVGLKRVVAFKLYPACGASTSLQRQRLEREAQLLARLQHENIVTVFDAGRMPDGSVYLVVQRLSGESLATRLLGGPLPVIEAVELTSQILDALAALNEAGITHRDIKPENLVLESPAGGRTLVKLVDFGIAKAVHDESSRELDEMVGTPRYMPPEQIRGEAIDARSDLYALGATLYEMLSGQPPYAGDLHQAVKATLCGRVTPLRQLRPDCPEELARIVMKALAPDPAARFASAHEMKRALAAWQSKLAAGRTLSAGAPRAGARSGSPLHASARRRTTLAVACASALAGFALSQALHDVTRLQDVSRQISARAAQVSELASPEAAAQAGEALSALFWRTSASAGELYRKARARAQDWFDTSDGASSSRSDGLPF